MRVRLSAGRPTEASTKIMVKRPPCGMPAPPVAEAVAVKLQMQSLKWSYIQTQHESLFSVAFTIVQQQPGQ